MKDELKILIVDDSIIFRKAVEESLAHESQIKIIGSVRNGVKAMDVIKTNPPDIVTLDVEMPEMNGIETLHAITAFNKQYNTNIDVLMISAYTSKNADITIKALENGAFDFITKPTEINSFESFKRLRRQLLTKIRCYNVKKYLVTTNTLRKKVRRQQITSGASGSIEAMFIGSSTGGPKALCDILPQISHETTQPIFIVQHIQPNFTESLARSLDAKCSHTVTEAHDYEIVKKNHIYIAPGNKHLIFDKNKQGQIITRLNINPPEKGFRPAINVMFRSAATVYGKHALAMILTGMGDDGTKGLGALKRKGAFIIAQDKASSVVWGMPGNAVQAGVVDIVLPLNNIYLKGILPRLNKNRY